MQALPSFRYLDPGDPETWMVVWTLMRIPVAIGLLSPAAAPDLHCSVRGTACTRPYPSVPH